MKAKAYGKRGWLRPRTSVGPMTAFMWHVKDESWGPPGKERCTNISSEFALRDCNQEISIDMWCTERKHVTKHVRALDKLINELTTCRQALLDMVDEVME